MRIIVQKFGGTSVAGELGWSSLAGKVQAALDEGLCPVVVVSAMGRCPAPYATDSLLSLITPYAECADVQERDMLMACGEIISTVVLSHYLRAQGINAKGFSGPQAGIFTDDNYSEAQITAVDPSRLLKALNAGLVPVVAGFQGLSSQQRVATLGRGGSDTTAVALGAALQAEKVEIYTDVDGIMTADPRCVGEAKVLDSLTYMEVGEMAREGARVLHPRAAVMAKTYNIPVVVRSTFSDHSGTLLVSDDNFAGEQSALKQPLAASHNSEIALADREGAVPLIDRVAGRGQVATGIVTVPGRCAINVDLAWADDYQEARMRVLESMASHMVSLDMIDVVGNHLYFLINQSDLVPAREYLRELGYGFTVCQNCAKVSVVGHNMRGVPGVMRRICRALASASVRLLYATDSHITISCVVPEEQMQLAARNLHAEFSLQDIR
ncbi:MAG: aspartate kinase [bacterium]|nr:aspartate kinase [bacterium]